DDMRGIRLRAELDMQEVKLLALDINLLIDGGGMHQLLVHFIELERLAIILDDDARGAAGPHEIPQAMFDNRRADRDGGLVSLLAVTLAEAAQGDRRPSLRAPVQDLGHRTAAYAGRSPEGEAPTLVLAVVVLEDTLDGDGFKSLEPQET